MPHPSSNHTWTCPVCDGTSWRSAFRTTIVPDFATTDAAPSDTTFGSTLAPVVRCETCGHGSLQRLPDPGTHAAAYEGSDDPDHEREAPGRARTADRDLRAVAQLLGPPDEGRLLDVGCWTGAYLAAAEALGWTATGIEPSKWAATQASDDGLDARHATIDDHGLGGSTFRVVVACDVIEHLLDPRAAVATLHDLLEPGGLLFVTVPDAGSTIARTLGRRWWAVLPMHVQYFTRPSLARLLEGAGFEIVSMRTHPKAFSRRYYAERVAAFAPFGARVARRALERGRPEALTCPDLRDRVAVIARRRP